MAPRIPPNASPEPEALELLAKSPSIDGRPLNIFATLAHHPLLLRRYNALGGMFLFSGRLAPRDREIVILRVAWRTGCVYEFGQHTRIGRQAGLTDDEIARLARPGLEAWAAPDRLLVAMVDDLQSEDRVTDGTWQDLAQRCSEPELVELLALAGFYRMTAGILNSLGVELEPGVPGWPPGGSPAR